MSIILKYILRSHLRKWLLDNPFIVNSYQLPTNYCYLRYFECRGKCLWQNCSTIKNYSTKMNDNDKCSKAKKSNNALRITLIQHGAILITTLEEANKLAKRRGMHLLQTSRMDAKTQRPVYKLVSPSDVLNQEFNQITANEGISSTSKSNRPQQTNEKIDEQLIMKAQKLLNISSRISPNDLSSRLKNITKWLNKHHEIRILIQGSHNDGDNCEQICKTIENHITTTETIGKITQQQRKMFGIVLNIQPVLVKHNNSYLPLASPAA